MSTKKKEKSSKKGTFFAKSVSVDAEWDKSISRRMSELGIDSFTTYARMLIGNDLKQGGELSIKLHPKGPETADHSGKW